MGRKQKKNRVPFFPQENWQSPKNKCETVRVEFQRWMGDNLTLAPVIEKQEISVIVKRKISLTDYVVRLSDYTESYAKLKADMDQFYYSRRNIRQSEVGLAAGQTCVYYDIGKLKPHRVFVNNLREVPIENLERGGVYGDPHVADVYCLDSGKSERVRQCDLFQMHAPFADEPVSLYKVRLNGLQRSPKYVRYFGKDCQHYWDQFDASNDFSMVVRDWEEDEVEEYFLVDLYQNSVNVKRFLSQGLLQAISKPTAPGS